MKNNLKIIAGIMFLLMCLVSCDKKDLQKEDIKTDKTEVSPVVKESGDSGNLQDESAGTKTDDSTGGISSATENENYKEVKGIDASASCIAVWISTAASLDGVMLEPEVDGKMEMQLALFDNGQYIMAVYHNDEMIENYPQMDKYTITDDMLELSGIWKGQIKDNVVDLVYNDGTNTLTFHCTLVDGK